jgi:hypothetical protein
MDKRGTVDIERGVQTAMPANIRGITMSGGHGRVNAMQAF